MAIEVTGVIGGGSMLLAGIFSGAFISRHQAIDIVSTETAEDKKSRDSISTILVIFGLPFIAIALVIYLVIT